MNQVAELLGVILLLPVCLQTRGGVVACSTTFEGRRYLCSVQSDVSMLVSKSFPCDPSGVREANKMLDNINSLLYRCHGHGIRGTGPDGEDRVRDRHYVNGHW